MEGRLLEGTPNYIGVASRFELQGNPAAGIAAAYLLSDRRRMVVNGEGAVFYGGNISGIPTEPAGNSPNGRVFILLHELAHLAGARIQHEDLAAETNARNNEIIWSNCRKTILGR